MVQEADLTSLDIRRIVEKLREVRGKR